MNNSSTGVRRPFLYFVVAAFAVAMAIPLAIASGQDGQGGIFDECFDRSCNSAALIASAD